jgi:hypothetical protein
MLRDDSIWKRRLDSVVHYQLQLLEATNFSYSTLPTSATLRYQLQLLYATNFSYSTLPTSATQRYQLQLLDATNFSYSTQPTSATQRYKSFIKNIFVCFVIKIPHAGILFCFLTFIMAAGKEQRTKLH